MTDYEKGFMSKCAEAGISADDALFLLKQAGIFDAARRGWNWYRAGRQAARAGFTRGTRGFTRARRYIAAARNVAPERIAKARAKLDPYTVNYESGLFQSRTPGRYSPMPSGAASPHAIATSPHEHILRPDIREMARLSERAAVADNVAHAFSKPGVGRAPGPWTEYVDSLERAKPFGLWERGYKPVVKPPRSIRRQIPKPLA